jgi:hypothetical protein
MPQPIGSTGRHTSMAGARGRRDREGAPIQTTITFAGGMPLKVSALAQE